jgi:hypothetical protein
MLVPAKSITPARIRSLHDANAAESVGKLPGVSLIREGIRQGR